MIAPLDLLGAAATRLLREYAGRRIADRLWWWVHLQRSSASARVEKDSSPPTGDGQCPDGVHGMGLQSRENSVL